MKWETAALNFVREVARIHGLARDEVFEAFVEKYTAEVLGGDIVTHHAALLSYTHYTRLTPQ